MKTPPVIQIAIADDHPGLRDSFADYINKDERFNVYILADNGKELLEKIDNAPYQPDVCIIDISMPVMDGYETMLQLKNKYPHVQGVVFTVADPKDEYPVLKMIKNGASGFISKSSRREEFTKILIDISATGFSCSEAVLKKFPGMSPENIGTYTKKMLSDRQVLFLSLNRQGLNYFEISDKMGVSKRTVESYAAKLYKKLGIHSRIELALYAQKAGIA